MRWSAWLREYLTFTRKERIGLLVVVLVIVIIWIAPHLIRPTKSSIALGDTSWISAAKILHQKEHDSTNDSKTKDETLDAVIQDRPATGNKTRADLFYFDPNTLSHEGWQKLGLPEKTITTIERYLSKGGHFNSAGDLKKIYGINPNQLAMLLPYVKIETTARQAPTGYTKNDFKRGQVSNGSVEINFADTSAFIALPGIGSKLALRIVNFREKLGGFYSVDQVGEVYGLADSTFAKIKPLLKCENASVKRINVNTASKDELKSHPYIKWNLASAIVEYRTQHGNFSSVEDLKKIAAVTEDLFAKIKAYLSTE